MSRLILQRLCPEALLWLILFFSYFR